MKLFSALIALFVSVVSFAQFDDFYKGNHLIVCNVKWDAEYGNVNGATVLIQRMVLRHLMSTPGDDETTHQRPLNYFKVYTQDMPEVMYEADNYSFSLYDIEAQKRTGYLAPLTNVIVDKYVDNKQGLTIAYMKNGNYMKFVFNRQTGSGYVNHNYKTVHGDYRKRKMIYNNCRNWELSPL